MAFHGTEYTDTAKMIMRSIEQAYIQTANREAVNAATQEGEGGQRFSIRTYHGSGANSNLESASLVGEVDNHPMLNAIHTLYTKGKDFAAKLFNMKYFDVAKTPDFMKEVGLTGDKFTVRYGVMSRHFGKDGSHNFTEEEWQQLPGAIQNPFAISKLSDKKDGYRIYTTLKTEKGEYVVVGADVKNVGRNLEVNSIATIFGRRNDANLPKNENVIYKSKEITPEQMALLSQPNSDQYPSTQELSAAKIDNSSETAKENGEKFSLKDTKLEKIGDNIYRFTPAKSKETTYMDANGNQLHAVKFETIKGKKWYEGFHAPKDLDIKKVDGKYEVEYLFGTYDNLDDAVEQLGKLYDQSRFRKVGDGIQAEFQDKGIVKPAKVVKFITKEQADTISMLTGKSLAEIVEMNSKSGKYNIRFSLKQVNDKFNEQLGEFTMEDADNFVFDLGRPSEKLLSAGVADKPIRLNGSKLAKKIKKHGFEPSELKDLPQAMENPIAVFDNLGRDGNRSILTELKTANGYFLVTIDLGKGAEADFDVISSVFGKNGKGVVYWINHDMMKYVDKEKALNYLYLSAPIAEASDNSELISAAKIVKDFENPKEKGEKFSLKDEQEHEFYAKRYSTEAEYIAKYDEAMQTGNVQLGRWAMANIRKAYRINHSDMKFSMFAKMFDSVKKELYSRYGNLDELQKQYEEEVMAARNMMEAARKKAEKEEAQRQKHIEELSLLSDDELDKRYMDAIGKNDEATAREMLDEAARRKGYGDVTIEYQGEGAWAAPSNPRYDTDEERRADIDNSPDVNLEDMALGYSLQPDDYFDNPRAYMNNTAHGLESAGNIKNAINALKRGEKDVKVKVYRAVPTSVKEGKLRNGDWGTPSRKYAEMHGNNRFEGKYRIIEDEVPANQLWWDGNDANEFGFDDGKEYKYKNVKNNRKLNDLVTRDDKGNIILPSKRFNSRKSDIRFSLVGEQGATAADDEDRVTTRMDNLQIAQAMEKEKKDAKAIKLATGWERGADGRWRYEIPDFQFNYDKWKDKNKEVRDGMSDKDFRSLKRYTNDFYEDMSPVRKRNFDELRRRTGYKIEEELTLGDVLDGKGAKNLFKYYPELRDVKFEYAYLGAYTIGSFDPETNTIKVNQSFMYNPRMTRLNLLHEVQHAIQRIEGFARGGSENAVRNDMNKKLDEVTKQIKQLKAEGKTDEAKVLIDKNKGLYNAYANEKDDFKNYQALAGEVEARNGQTRMGMADEERRNSLASETEDVAREDQIFLGQDDGYTKFSIKRFGTDIANASDRIKNLMDNEKIISRRIGSRAQAQNRVLDTLSRASSEYRRANQASAKSGQDTWEKDRALGHVIQASYGTGAFLTEEELGDILGEKVGKGNENYVYRSKDGKTVFKLNNLLMVDKEFRFNEFLDRIKAHNEFAPEDMYTPIGFALNEEGDFCVVLEQPYVQDSLPATQEEIDDYMEEHGYDLCPIRVSADEVGAGWSNGEFEIWDTKPRNVLKDKNGDLHFIDTVIQHTFIDGHNDKMRFSLRVDQYQHDLAQWKKDNNLPKDAERPAIPVREPNETAVDFANRVKEYRRQMALWKTAPQYEDHLLTDDTAQGQFNLELNYLNYSRTTIALKSYGHGFQTVRL